MSEEAKELAKQFVLYADAITAFAVVQLIGFIYLLARGDCFTQNVLYVPWVPMLISFLVNGIYLLLIHLCHRAEDALVGQPSSRESVLGLLVKRARGVRYGIIVGACLMTVGVLGLVSWSISRQTFSVDCKVDFKPD